MSFRKARGPNAAAALAFAGLIAAAGHAQAAEEFGYGVSLGVGHSDNITRVRDGAISDTIGAAGFNVNLDHQSRKLSATLLADFEYLKYFQNTFDDRFIGNLAGNGLFSLVPDRVTWMAEDNFGQTIINQFSPTTPTNEERVNFFTTGPDVTLRLSSALRAVLQGRYSNVNYEKSELGNNRVMGLAGLKYALSSASTVSLTASNEHISYDNVATGRPEFDRREAIAAYDLTGRRTNLSLEGGYTQLHSPGGDSNGVLARLHVSRRLSAATTLSFDAGREFSDAGDQFRDFQNTAAKTFGDTNIGAEPVQATSNPFLSTHATLAWNFSARRTSFSLGGSYYKDQYEAQPQFDRRLTQLFGDFHRQLNASLTASIGAAYSKNNYVLNPVDFSESSGQASLEWRLGHATYLTFEYRHSQRTDVILVNNYRENQLWVRMSYGVGQRGGGAQSFR